VISRAWGAALAREEDPGEQRCPKGEGLKVALALVSARGPVTAVAAAGAWGCSTQAAHMRLERAARSGHLQRTLRPARDARGRERPQVHYSTKEPGAVHRNEVVRLLSRVCAWENARVVQATADVVQDPCAVSESVRALRAVLRELMERGRG